MTPLTGHQCPLCMDFGVQYENIAQQMIGP